MTTSLLVCAAVYAVIGLGLAVRRVALAAWVRELAGRSYAARTIRW
jgi:hypothetical protein